MIISRKLKIILLVISFCLIYKLDSSSNLIFDNVGFEHRETDNYNLQTSIDQRVFVIIADPPDNEDWKPTINPEYPIEPDDYGIDSEGCYVSHFWNESIDSPLNRVPSIHWERNFSLVEDMSYWNITSASVNAVVNATVHANSGSIAGVDCPGDSVDRGVVFDYAEFYILISDGDIINEYLIAYFRSTDLGNDSAGEYDFLVDTYMETVPEAALIWCLNKVLDTDNHNFTVIMGIDIYCENNYILNDTDYWDILRIKSLNLSFTYELLPNITINSPTHHEIYGITAPDYNLSIAGLFETIWYTIDGGATNITANNLTGTIDQVEWDKLSDGIATITFFANNSGGFVGSAQVQVVKYVTEDNGSPQIPGYNLIALIGISYVVTLLILKKRKK